MTAICGKCGRDCRTKLALGKHEAKCDGITVVPEYGDDAGKWVFYDRHEGKGHKCPKCNEIWADFVILGEMDWVCLKCGCHFVPKDKLEEMREYVSGSERS